MSTITTTKRLTKREKRLLRQQGIYDEVQSPRLNFALKQIDPLTENQAKAFEYWANDKNILLHGIAGTGKTFLAMGLALKDLLSGYSGFDKLVLIRSVVPTRDMGFLPGNSREKARVYEAPYTAICAELFGRADAWEILKQKDIATFETTSFVRGLTINDAIIVVDEIQNMNYHELDSVITRVGKNCRIIFCGDFRQTDLQREAEKSGIKSFMRVLQEMKSFEFVDFGPKDIVRSATVREYILAKDRLGITG